MPYMVIKPINNNLSTGDNEIDRLGFMSMRVKKSARPKQVKINLITSPGGCR